MHFYLLDKTLINLDNVEQIERTNDTGIAIQIKFVSGKLSVFRFSSSEEAKKHFDDLVRFNMLGVSYGN